MPLAPQPGSAPRSAGRRHPRAPPRPRENVSPTVGAAKPAPEYFLGALEMAGVDADQALFVDDSAENISAAAALGLRTVHHPTDAGGRALRSELVDVLSAA